ncbi:hypothetical protein LCGC14_0935550 [marine sediment metagenome]|uniref:Uncharacterized protein n=1 Tax=marine sediment metagenome TaxID=412755 RepID=A0A0F9NLQ6_9ZZZZ
MISAFSIILEDDILYSSKKKKFSAFEIVLFVDKLLRSLNPKNNWRLNKVCLKNHKTTRERIIIEHIITRDNKNLFFCSVGNFKVGSEEAFKMLKDFVRQVSLQYRNLDDLKSLSKESSFKDIIKLITNFLRDKYIEPLEEEIIFEENGNQLKNTILYTGISAQGLPIISQLYDKDLLRDLQQEKTNEKIELFSSDLSAKLATISMNTQIRAKTNIKEIHMTDSDNRDSKKIIFFGNIKGYSLDFIASGNFYKLRDIFKD